MYVAILLPMPSPSYDRNMPWTVLAVHETTDGIFEEIAEAARDAGWKRDAERTNVYHLGSVSAVGWWCTLDSFYDELETRDRLGENEMSATLREALARVMA